MKTYTITIIYKDNIKVLNSYEILASDLIINQLVETMKKLNNSIKEIIYNEA